MHLHKFERNGIGCGDNTHNTNFSEFSGRFFNISFKISGKSTNEFFCLCVCSIELGIPSLFVIGGATSMGSFSLYSNKQTNLLGQEKLFRWTKMQHKTWKKLKNETENEKVGLNFLVQNHFLDSWQCFALGGA